MSNNLTRKYFGTDGVRGRFGTYPLTPDFVLKLGWAAGKVLSRKGSKKVIIGKDPRISGYLFESALQAGLMSAGLNVFVTGPLPTPAIAYLTKTFRAEAGVMISASHNPYHDNGIKFFSSDGEKLSDEIELAIEQMMEQEFVCEEIPGRAKRIDDAQGRYIEFCKSTFPYHLNLEQYKIVVDCANGATYHIAPKVFRELGAEVIEIGTEPNGFNINDKCGATDVALLKEKVVEHNADLGLAFDGDGDRLIAVDHLGNTLDGDQLIYIIALERLRKGSLQGGVVGTKMSNMALENAFAKHNIDFIRADVGDRYIMDQLRIHNWQLGAENSGHILMLNKTSTGDGIVASLSVLAAMVLNNKSLADFRNEIPLYPQVLINMRFSGENNPLENEKVLQQAAKIEEKLAKTGRVLLRKSGTEPLIRVMVEAEDCSLAQKYAEELTQTIKDLT